MKHIFLSIFVILFTIACCIFMYNFRLQELPMKVQIQEQPAKIIMPLNQEQNDKDISSDDFHNNQNRVEDNSYDEYGKDVDSSVHQEYSSKESGSISMIYESTSSSSAKYEAAAKEAQSLLTLREKLYLIGIARYLNGKDFSLIKKYIAEGATQEELDGLWDGIESRLPEKDYNKVYTIFLKYKR